MSALPAKPRSRRAWALSTACVLLAIAGCSDPSALDAQQGPEPTTDDLSAPRGEGRTGTLAFELRTANDAKIDAFDYAITGPNFARAGSIDVSNSNTLSARIDAIPAASGYSITVTGTSAREPVTQCSGSAAFDIVARTVNNVPIGISCRVTRSVTPPDPVAAPLPRSSTWLVGLALLGLGAALAKRSSAKRGA
jgi:hypothetical protein